jgi:hypothetical protein
MRDANGSFEVVSVDATKSDNTHAIQCSDRAFQKAGTVRRSAEEAVISCKQAPLTMSALSRAVCAHFESLHSGERQQSQNQLRILAIVSQA